MSVRGGLEGVLDDDKDSSEELATCPADGASDFWSEGVCDLHEIFEGDWEERKGGCA